MLEAQARELQELRERGGCGVLCARVPGQPGTILRRLGDLPHLYEVVERRSFHELFAAGWLEMAV
jgi:hypothetical protein